MVTRNRDEVIVPVRDRRSGRRIVTLRNFLKLALVAMVLFAVVTIRSEMRGKNQTDYGRIVSKELPAPPVAKAPEIVRETHDRDELSADPFLVAPAQRAQFLGNTALEPVPLIDPATTTQTAQGELSPPRQGEARTVIVNGPDGGVSIVQDQRPKPILSGGFGKQ